MREDRCDLSGLLVDQCGCRIHAPAPPASEHVVVARFPARFNSECDGCGERMREGDPIARTDEGNYICSACAS